jgi:dTDP-4-amino-4,6-dideoxygalactose transaminase
MIKKILIIPMTIAKLAVRKALVLFGIEPAYVRALIKTPPEVHGGPKARRFPWPRRKLFGKAEKKAVLRLMNREIQQGGALVYGGPEESAYCAAFVNFMGGGYADAVNSGTNAVYLALRALDLEPFTEVIVPPITDPGGCMPVAMLNCIPVPADTSPKSLNCSVEQIEAVLTERTSAIMVAHLAGHPVDMDPIIKLARDRSIPIIEDCAQAHGARYKGRLVGTMGDVAAFSTMYGKHHATGAQGGVVYTCDPSIFVRAKQAADRGKPFGAVISKPEYVTASLNFNQDELAMAIGRVQLAKLPRALVRRRTFARVVANGLRGVAGLQMVTDSADTESVHWFLMIQLDETKLHCSNLEFARALELEGIGGTSGGYPFFPTDHPWYTERVVFGSSGYPWANTSRPDLGREPFDLPNARAANRKCVRIDVHESLSIEDAGDLVKALKKLSKYFALKP